MAAGELLGEPSLANKVSDLTKDLLFADVVPNLQPDISHFLAEFMDSMNLKANSSNHANHSRVVAKFLHSKGFQKALADRIVYFGDQTLYPDIISYKNGKTVIVEVETLPADVDIYAARRGLTAPQHLIQTLIKKMRYGCGQTDEFYLTFNKERFDASVYNFFGVSLLDFFMRPVEERTPHEKRVVNNVAHLVGVHYLTRDYLIENSQVSGILLSDVSISRVETHSSRGRLII